MKKIDTTTKGSSSEASAPEPTSPTYVIKVVSTSSCVNFTFGVTGNTVPWQLRQQVPKKAWTMTDNSLPVPRLGRKPKLTKDEKHGFSKPQAVSVVKQGSNVSRAQFRLDNGLGIIIPQPDPDTVRFARIFKQDRGSFFRPYDGETSAGLVAHAHINHLEQFANTSDMLDHQMKSAQGRSSRHNEAFARIHWNNEKCQIAIFSKKDQATIEQKMEAQWRAHLIAAQTNTKHLPKIVFVELNEQDKTIAINEYLQKDQATDQKTTEPSVATYRTAIEQWIKSSHKAYSPDVLIDLIKELYPLNQNQPTSNTNTIMHSMLLIQLAYCIQPKKNGDTVDTDGILLRCGLPHKKHDIPPTNNHATHILHILKERELKASNDTIVKLLANLKCDFMQSINHLDLHKSVTDILKHHMTDVQFNTLVQDVFIQILSSPHHGSTNNPLYTMLNQYGDTATLPMELIMQAYKTYNIKHDFFQSALKGHLTGINQNNMLALKTYLTTTGHYTNKELTPLTQKNPLTQKISCVITILTFPLLPILLVLARFVSILVRSPLLQKLELWAYMQLNIGLILFTAFVCRIIDVPCMQPGAFAKPQTDAIKAANTLLSLLSNKQPLIKAQITQLIQQICKNKKAINYMTVQLVDLIAYSEQSLIAQERTKELLEKIETADLRKLLKSPNLETKIPTKSPIQRPIYEGVDDQTFIQVGNLQQAATWLNESIDEEITTEEGPRQFAPR